MHRSPSTTALAAVVAVLALAAAAGALGSADLGGGLSVDSDEPAQPGGAERATGPPTEPNQPSGSGDTDCGLACSLPTARSLLGALFVPLSPTLLAGGAVLLGLLLVAARRGSPGDGQPTEIAEVASTDGIGGGADATPSDPEYDCPETDTVVTAFRRLRGAAVDCDSTGDSAALDSLTPRDVRAAAVETGYDPEAVTTVVRAFEAVRYGDGALTAAREQAVEDALAALDPEVSAA